MRDLAVGRPDLDLTSHEMLQQIHHKYLDLEDLPKWFKRADSTFHKFCKAFQKTPPPPPLAQFVCEINKGMQYTAPHETLLAYLCDAPPDFKAQCTNNMKNYFAACTI